MGNMTIARTMKRPVEKMSRNLYGVYAEMMRVVMSAIVAGRARCMGRSFGIVRQARIHKSTARTSSARNSVEFFTASENCFFIHILKGLPHSMKLQCWYFT